MARAYKNEEEFHNDYARRFGEEDSKIHLFWVQHKTEFYVTLVTAVSSDGILIDGVWVSFEDFYANFKYRVDFSPCGIND